MDIAASLAGRPRREDAVVPLGLGVEGARDLAAFAGVVDAAADVPGALHAQARCAPVELEGAQIGRRTGELQAAAVEVEAFEQREAGIAALVGVAGQRAVVAGHRPPRAGAHVEAALFPAAVAALALVAQRVAVDIAAAAGGSPLVRGQAVIVAGLLLAATQRAVAVVDVATAGLVVEAGRPPLPLLVLAFRRQQSVRSLRTGDVDLPTALLIAARRSSRFGWCSRGDGADSDADQDKQLKRIHDHPQDNDPSHHLRVGILNYSLTNPRMFPLLVLIRARRVDAVVPLALGVEGAGDLRAFAGVVNAAAHVPVALDAQARGAPGEVVGTQVRRRPRELQRAPAEIEIVIEDQGGEVAAAGATAAPASSAADEAAVVVGDRPPGAGAQVEPRIGPAAVGSLAFGMERAEIKIGLAAAGAPAARRQAAGIACLAALAAQRAVVVVDVAAAALVVEAALPPVSLL